jgi:hypothetical protein
LSWFLAPDRDDYSFRFRGYNFDHPTKQLLKLRAVPGKSHRMECTITPTSAVYSIDGKKYATVDYPVGTLGSNKGYFGFHSGWNQQPLTVENLEIKVAETVKAIDFAKSNELDLNFHETFDLAFSVSEDYLNKTLKKMWSDGGLPSGFVWEERSKKKKILRKQLIIESVGPTRLSLDGVDKETGRTLNFSKGSSQILVVVPVTKGSWFSQVYDDDEEEYVKTKKKIDTRSGMFISYVVKLDIGSANAKGLQLTPEIKAQVDKWSNEMFDPYYLYMNFEDPSIIDSFRIKTYKPLDSALFGTELLQAFTNLGTVYLEKQEKENPFVFAAIKVAKDPNYKGDSFELTGATFSVDRQSNKSSERSLSYLFVSSGVAPSSYQRFSFNKPEEGGYLTNKDFPARMYHNPQNFLNVILQGLSKSVASKPGITNDAINNKAGKITFDFTTDGTKVTNTITTVLVEGTNTIQLKMRSETIVPQKFLFIDTDADVTYWNEIDYVSSITLDDKTMAGLKFSDFKETRKADGDDMTFGQELLKGLSFLNIFAAISQIIQLIDDGDGNDLVDNFDLKKLGVVGAGNIVMPGQGKLIFKGFAFNQKGLPNIQALYNAKRPDY